MVGIDDLRANEVFDHATHALKVKAEGQKRVTCNGCHKLTAQDSWAVSVRSWKRKRNHNPCDNSNCHAREFLYFKVKAKKSERCLSCHLEIGKKALRFPPHRRRGQSDFVLATFDHGSHYKEISDDSGSKCEGCHEPRKRQKPSQADMKPTGHSSCGSSGCHGQKNEPKMRDCSGCHQDASDDEALAASNAWHSYRVRLAFGHQAHAKVSKRDTCLGCHNNTAVPQGSVVPLPQMMTCESCHDGHAAFDALGQECRRCHIDPKRLRK